jgi:hypothetical protein
MNVQTKKDRPPILKVIIANPNHSVSSPKKLGHEILLNNPPFGIV